MKPRVPATSWHAKSLVVLAVFIFAAATIGKLQYAHYRLANRLSHLEATQQSRSRLGGGAVPGTSCPTSLQPGQKMPAGCSTSSTSSTHSSTSDATHGAPAAGTFPTTTANSSSTTHVPPHSPAPQSHQAHASSINRDWVFNSGLGTEESSVHLNAILDAGKEVVSLFYHLSDIV